MESEGVKKVFSFALLSLLKPLVPHDYALFYYEGLGWIRQRYLIHCELLLCIVMVQG